LCARPDAAAASCAKRGVSAAADRDCAAADGGSALCRGPDASCAALPENRERLSAVRLQQRRRQPPVAVVRPVPARELARRQALRGSKEDGGTGQRRLRDIPRIVSLADQGTTRGGLLPSICGIST
jgi:hypothetical protein